MLVQVKGMKKLEAAIHPNNYKTLWCAGQSVELINDVLPSKAITERLINELTEARKNLLLTLSGEEKAPILGEINQ
ncbi:hypothetical protein D3C86_1892670 [compost metagenome]